MLTDLLHLACSAQHALPSCHVPPPSRVQDEHGRWKVVKLRKLDPNSRDLLLSRVYRGGEDENLGFFSRVRERIDRCVALRT